MPVSRYVYESVYVFVCVSDFVCVCVCVCDEVYISVCPCRGRRVLGVGARHAGCGQKQKQNHKEIHRSKGSYQKETSEQGTPGLKCWLPKQNMSSFSCCDICWNRSPGQCHVVSVALFLMGKRERVQV